MFNRHHSQVSPHNFIRIQSYLIQFDCLVNRRPSLLIEREAEAMNFRWLALIFQISLTLGQVDNKRYQAVIDCGSTGSRIYIFRFNSLSPLQSIVELSSKRVNPALSTFHGRYNQLKKHLSELVDFATEEIPQDMHHATHLTLKATAGMRTIPADQQQWIMRNARDILANTSFAFIPSDTRILSGGEEALFGLLATNIAFANVTVRSGLLLGAADLGGSSKQVAFMLPQKTFIESVLANYIIPLGIWSGVSAAAAPMTCDADFRLTLPDPSITSGSVTYNIIARSVAGLGLVASMEEVFQNLRIQQLSQQETIRAEQLQLPVDKAGLLLCEKGQVCSAPSERSLLQYIFSAFRKKEEEEKTIISNPCAPPGENIPYPTHLTSPTTEWRGSGDFDQCAIAISALLQSKAGTDQKCLQQLRRSMPQRIVAMDNFPKTLEVIGLPEKGTMTISPAMVKARGMEICQVPWTELQKKFPDFVPYRLHQACFSAVFTYTMMTEFYGLDEDDNSTFLPSDSHESFTIGWALGAAIVGAMNISYEEIGNSSL